MQYRSNQFAKSEIVKNLIILNVLFLLGKFAMSKFGVNLDQLFGLFYFESIWYKPWQLLTHFFMHADLFHLFVNMFALWMFGSRLEQLWGPKRFLTFYLITAVGAIALHSGVKFIQLQQIMENISDLDYQMVLNEGRQLLLSGRTYTDPDLRQLNEILNVNAVGASGAVFGILAAFAMYFPNTRIMLLIPPIPIKAKWFVLIYAGFELTSGVANFQGDNVAHFAHLGGALFGFLMVKYWNKNNRSSLY